jgi:hypothetical protein
MTTQTEISNLDKSERSALIARLMELHKGVNQAYALRDTQRLEAGQILLSLRKATPHGEWEPQLVEICKAIGMSRSTAHNYMNAAEKGAVPKLKDGDTVNGYPMDVIRHCFQTAIRTGNEHRALQCTIELDQSGSAEWLWYRMPIIASEDVGLARLGLQREIDDLRVQWKRKRNDKRFNSHRLFLIHAVLLLVRVMKSRLSDHALIEYYNNQQPIEISEAEINDATANATDSIVIIDDDLDKHSAVGRAKGRRGNTAEGINHFFDVSARLNNPAPIDDPYKEDARKTLIAKTTNQTVAA